MRHTPCPVGTQSEGCGVDDRTGVQETAGIELMPVDFGPDFPGGLFVAQVGDNLPQTRNFKLVNRADVVAALGL